LQTGQEPGKGSKLEQVQTGISALPVPERLSVRSRFRLTSPGLQAGYQFDSAEIMSLVSPATPVDRTGTFAALRERERLAQALRRLHGLDISEFAR
jgi:hypothetical protein